MPRGQETALEHEIRHDAMESGAVIESCLGQPEKIAHVIGGQLRKEFKPDAAERCFEHRSVPGQFLRRGLGKSGWRYRLRGPQGDFLNHWRIQRNAIRIRRGLRDPVHYLDPLGDKAKSGVLPVKLRLWSRADEKLIPSAFRLAGKEDAGNRAPDMLDVGQLGADLVRAAGAPEILLRRIPGKGIAALDDSPFHDPMEARPVISAFGCQFEE